MSDTRTTTDKQRLVEREFQNIRELLELLMTEMSMAGQKVRTGPPFAWAPPTDVYETETEVIVTMDIAGMELRDIAVFTDGNVITIRGVRQEIAPRCKKQFHKLEIQVGPFQRIIQVPVPIDLQSISQTYANGLLEVRIKRVFDPDSKRKVKVE
jgi:HSP20 family molecular chaperone IbpA